MAPFLSAGQAAPAPASGEPGVRVPGFWDPRRRPEKPDLSRISVIRFLTETDYPLFNFAGPDGNPQGDSFWGRRAADPWVGYTIDTHESEFSEATGCCMSSEHFGQLAWQFKRMSGSSGLKVPACGSANIPDCLFSALRYALVHPSAGKDLTHPYARARE